MTIDAISLAVFNNLFSSVAEEMGVALQRSSFSPNIKERQDFSCALFDARGRMVAQAAHIPVHLGSMPASVTSALNTFPQIEPGDIIVLNDPYHGGTHLPDVTMISPVFSRGDVCFFVASRAHHADIGGMSPGSLPLSQDLYQEGLIIPPLKLAHKGTMQAGIISMITANSRSPEEREGDIKAQIAAQQIGERRLQALISRHGIETLLAHAPALMSYARQRTEKILAAIPAGKYQYQDVLEGPPPAEEDLPIHCTVTVDDSRMMVDFQGSASQIAGNLNAVKAVVQSATWYCIRLLAEDEIPMNHGCFQPIEIATPPRSILNPDFPAAVAAGNVETSQRIVDVVLGALAQALPHKIPAASQGTMNNIAFGGTDHGKTFVFYETIAGGHGAGPDADGLSGRHSHMTNTRNTPIEAMEHALPVQILSYRLRSGSGGAGRFRGGEGIKRTYKFLAPATVTINSERRKHPPYGLQGGHPGQTGRNRLIRDGDEKILRAKETFQVEAGDVLVIHTPGGGGWGSPGHR